jgi:hypothetical protein
MSTGRDTFNSRKPPWEGVGIFLPRSSSPQTENAASRVIVCETVIGVITPGSVLGRATMSFGMRHFLSTTMVPSVSASLLPPASVPLHRAGCRLSGKW